MAGKTDSVWGKATRSCLLMAGQRMKSSYQVMNERRMADYCSTVAPFR